MAAAAMEELFQHEREIVVAHIWGGLTFEQIGKMLGSSKSSVHRKYYEGLARLKEKWVES